MRTKHRTDAAPGGGALVAPGIEAVVSADGAHGGADDDARRRARWPVGAYLAAGWLIFIIAAAILAPYLPLPEWNKSSADLVRSGPLDGSLLGGDRLGRDVFARCIWGARTSLLVGFGAIALGLLVGGALGLIAGYYRNRAAIVLSSLFDILLAFPQLVLALTLVAVLAPAPTTANRRLVVLILTLGIVSIPILGRITRANTLSWSQREFVMAAQSQGAKHGRVMVREVLPNVLPAMFSIALLGVAVVIVTEGGLAILGLSIPDGERASWGNILASSAGDLDKTAHAIFAPSAFIFLTVMSLNYLGDVIRARFDVRESAI